MVVEWEQVIEDETILWEGRPHVGLAVGLGVLGMLIAIAGAVILQTALTDGSVVMAFLLGGPPFLIGVFVGLAGGSRRLRTRYAVTNHAVYVYHPWPFGGLTRTELGGGSATIRRDPMGRLLGTGDVVVETSNERIALVGTADAEEGLNAVERVLEKRRAADEQPVKSATNG